eukprot:sb/3469135/
MCVDEELTSVEDVYYFEGDYWYNQLEDFIAELDKEELELKQLEEQEVYHEILLAYLNHVRNRGYVKAHIWACPPHEGDDYIFHCHPETQKTPKPKRLQDWYKTILERGKVEGVVFDYKNIFQMCVDEELTSVEDVYYFEGDYWYNQLEDFIAELDKEELELKQLEEQEEFDEPSMEDSTSVDGKVKSSKSKAQKKATNKSKKNQAKRSNAKKTLVNSSGDPLFDKVYQNYGEAQRGER